MAAASTAASRVRLCQEQCTILAIAQCASRLQPSIPRRHDPGQARSKTAVASRAPQRRGGVSASGLLQGGGAGG